MITMECIKFYRSLFPDSDCAYAEPGYCVYVHDKENNISYISPTDETNEIFIDRLDRCKRDKHNYFFDEWKRLVYEPGKIY